MKQIWNVKKKPLVTRQKNLHHYRKQPQPEIPSFLQEEQHEATKNTDSTAKTAASRSPKLSKKTPLMIVMTNKSIFFFFLVVSLVAILCFLAGFLVSYMWLTPKIISEQTQVTSKTRTVQKSTSFSTNVSPVQEIMFSIELAHSDSDETAQQMLRDLREKKLDAYITTTEQESGRTYYIIQVGRYNNYTDAYQALQKLPQPYSLWGKVIKNMSQDVKL